MASRRRQAHSDHRHHDVASEGLAFVSGIQILASELLFTFKLRERTIESRVRVERGEPMQAPERIVHRYFCVFTAIAADDWDAVVRYVENKPEPKPAEPPKAVVDDEFRALPGRVQDGIVACLVRAKRLAPPSPGDAPLIRLRAGSVRDLGGGRSVRDVLIHSRIVTRDDGLRSYDTRFRVYSDERIEAARLTLRATCSADSIPRHDERPSAVEGRSRSQRGERELGALVLRAVGEDRASALLSSRRLLC